MNPAIAPSIAFIGLGVMGGPMARNLAAAGFRLAVFDQLPAAVQRLSDTSCHPAGGPADAARDADVTITMLPTTHEVREVLLGSGGAARAMRANGLVIDMSTGSAVESDALARDLRAIGLRHLDAPVGRSPREAVSGKLLVMAGGDATDVEEARPLFEAMADTIVHVGPSGSGIRLKLVNNYMSMVTMVLTGEALMFAAKLGLDRRTVVDVLSTTAAGRGQLLTNFPRKVLAGDITPDFPLRMGYKDLNLALDLAASVGAPLGLGAYAREMYALAKSWGRSEQDCTAMLLLLEDIAHLPHDEAADS
ncbi:MAG TPA: NAD(P)-dependent oxidoreductase [Casimicrobiaceae bacterium]|nr:NAD(P)-dependent oxidoreductase [Casimicrobiaceae bacterium]